MYSALINLQNHGILSRNPSKLDLHHCAHFTYPVLREQCGESFHLQLYERCVLKKNPNLFIIIYIFVEAKIQSLLLCLFTSTNDAIEYKRM